MNEIKIPKEFQVFGQTIRVEFIDDLTYPNDTVGESHPRLNRIVLQKNSESVKVQPEQLEKTFIHEVIHMVLDLMKEQELSQNEPFVTVFSNLLHQVFKTAKY